jgi:hypothetical protein
MGAASNTHKINPLRIIEKYYPERRKKWQRKF